ncbi:hypothetical protein [Mesorhizobium sp. CN2-181]|uniref:hypothetical protein n=1 Tax=Mesorhizobium yinganensis TaxID=3157707 RepID=UPI0032B8492E
MDSDPKVEPMLKRPKVEKSSPVIWTPWGPQKFSERDAQLAARRRLGRKVEKLGARKPVLVG